jgi:hypothetical protein
LGKNGENGYVLVGRRLNYEDRISS